MKYIQCGLIYKHGLFLLILSGFTAAKHAKRTGNISIQGQFDIVLLFINCDYYYSHNNGVLLLFIQALQQQVQQHIREQKKRELKEQGLLPSSDEEEETKTEPEVSTLPQQPPGMQTIWLFK